MTNETRDELSAVYRAMDADILYREASSMGFKLSNAFRGGYRLTDGTRELTLRTLADVREFLETLSR